MKEWIIVLIENGEIFGRMDDYDEPFEALVDCLINVFGVDEPPTLIMGDNVRLVGNGERVVGIRVIAGAKQGIVVKENEWDQGKMLQ